MLHEVSAEQQPQRLAFLVAKFRKAVVRQRQQDDATLASVVRALKRGGPDAERFYQLIDHRPLHASSGRRDEVSR